MEDESQEQKLREEFSNYERTVWIINCLEGHLRKYYNDLLSCFDRFPQIPNGSENPLTPDFTVVFVGSYEIIGEVKRSLGNQEESIKNKYQQLKRYDRKLLLKAKPGATHSHESQNHDVVLFINVEFAKKEASKLCELVKADRSRGTFKRGLSVFAQICDSQQAKVKWIFDWISCSDRLNDDVLPKGRRLSERHQDNGETIIVYPEVYAGMQAIHNFCNDNPPDVYLAVVLWSRIFPKLIPQDLRETWVMEKDCQGTVEFEVPPDSITDYSKKFLGYSLRKASLENVLLLLAKAGLVEKKSSGSYKIHYRKFRP